MLFLSLLILFAIFGMLVFSYIILKAVFSLAGILIIAALLMIPFIWIVHPWFELVIIILLVMLILQRQNKEVN